MNQSRKVSDMGLKYELADCYIVKYTDSEGFVHTVPFLYKKQAEQYEDAMKRIYENADIISEKTFKSTKEY
jgi:hypothetical protein|uniref:Uncharacterized protein n=1 Tax=Siphoviridae sp. ct43U4 TaxID=2826285 RepID=A0A8S5MZS6_9CAUD|nr:MAG TPA: hypothetical protein [Siphoviridae sp. ct43U4]